MKTFMRSLLLLVTGVILFLGTVHAQIVADSFTDGDFTNNPTWSGDDGVFSVNTDSQLQLVDAVAEQSYLATSFPSASLSDKEWRMYIKQSFAGSDANQSRFYFASSAPAQAYSGAGSAGVTGYFFN